ncbi:hypothetical protein SARC_02549 [Sphaeroforma arctica JP610]|uniref:SWIM-type domain-containing protein n=1 Tax=Sphaeroforma arctica JP610 TaxID=667725 RepID=A0A0L0GAH6_9EUKA|nr:hypothetical protein SARC_02549 [Sphaeroforma arctica JP610]KNC85253.1 hypothetical protein SARC_02549 [Sphaeroforma arctica JP610]|eukprot:XP_014159155.1 hypothetical protein SARC_02549 [Sphaeroforma arctica JP610]
MPSSKKGAFGLTPWGRELLNAMASLGGRLERGAALARSGKVFKTEIKGNSVTSKVKGVSSPFYTVSCTWPRFQGEQKNVIVKLIQQNPQFLGEILRGNLPVDLIKAIQHLAAQSGGVALLPTSYHELNGQCNCPDNMGGGGGGYYGRSAKRSGDPCKHQAGLFYMIIKEVDNNPFTLFTLHGLDIIVSLGMQSVGQATTTLAYPFAITQYAHDSDAHTEPQSTTDTVALPKLCAATTFISRLLSPNPVFDSTCDFRDVLLRVYTLATAKGKGSKKLLAEPVWMAGLEQEDVDRLHAILSHSHIKVHVCAGLEPSKTFVSIDNELFKTDDKDASSGDYMNMLHPANLMRSQSISMGMPVVALDTLLALLLRFQAGHVGSPSYRYFWQCARLAFICVSSGCFLPIVIPTDTTGSGRCWSVRYRPLRCNTAVAETAAQLRQLYPVPTPARGSLKTQGVMFNTNYEMVDGKYILLAPEAGTEIALTMFISSLVYRLALPAIQPLHATFYKPQQYMALTLGDQSLGRSVGMY